MVKWIDDLLEHVPAFAKDILDIAAAGAMLAALVSALPKIAALFTIAWTGLRFYDRFNGRKVQD